MNAAWKLVATILPAAFLAGSSLAAASPTVVEIFQSQGCSSCPPANANVMAVSERPDVLTLSFGVTYWDQLGWKDTFASPQYTARQWDYARAFRRTEVFTPEVVVNGRADVVGTNRAELDALIHGQANTGGPDVRISGGIVSIGAAAPRDADVLLVRFDPNIVQVPIARGENGGRTLPHKNVVKALVKLGEWSGKSSTYRIPPSPNGEWREAILVQAGLGGSILAAARD
jgi:hypothetical protein